MSDADCTPGREPRSVAASFLTVVTARSELRKVLLFGAVCDFFVCWTDLRQVRKEDVFGPSLGRVWMSRSKVKVTIEGQKWNDILPLSAACMLFMFGKISSASCVIFMFLIFCLFCLCCHTVWRINLIYSSYYSVAFSGPVVTGSVYRLGCVYVCLWR